MNIDAVIFDWGGTLTPWHTIDHREQWLHYAAVYAPERADELSLLLVEQEDLLWKAGREHHRSATLDEVFRNVGIEPSGDRHQAALEAYHRWWDPHTYLDPDAPGLFTGLRERGIRVGVLSNTLWSREHHEQVFRRDGVLDLVDGAVYSSEIPYTKPHPEAFRAAMAAVGAIDPARCVFVGDRPFEDVHGAKDVGMRAVLVPHSEIPVDQRGHTEGEPDAVVQRLGELLAIIESWNGEL
ncbi:MAG TPA: HAD family hydrolase [Actinomycetes bacterium]